METLAEENSEDNPALRELIARILDVGKFLQSRDSGATSERVPKPPPPASDQQPFFSIPCTPFSPFTVWVTWKSTASEQNW